MPVFDIVGVETAAKLYECLFFTEIENLNDSKSMCMPVFDREWGLKW
jgi:hypothetical protein